MTKNLTKKEKGFANDFIDSGNGVESAMNNYDVSSYSSAGAIASQNLKKLKIQAYIADKAEDASSMVYKLSQEAEAEQVRLSASKDILDRAGFKPIEESKSVNVNIELTQSSEIKELTNKINDLYRRAGESSYGGTTNIVDNQTQDKE